MKRLRDYLREIVSDNTTRKGRIFDYCIQALILISLVSFSIDTLPNLDSQTQKILDLIELVSIIIFSTEYFLRIFVAKRPFKYIFSFYGLIDLLAILPFYIRTALDLRVLRTFRVFRIFRSLKLIRYNRALERFHIATRVICDDWGPAIHLCFGYLLF
jgi:voltage-gated potassium channel